MFLAMGGIALGYGVRSSGLMDTMDGIIHRTLEGLTLYSVVVVLSVIVLVRLPFVLSLIPFTSHVVRRLSRHLSATRSPVSSSSPLLSK